MWGRDQDSSAPNDLFYHELRYKWPAVRTSVGTLNLMILWIFLSALREQFQEAKQWLGENHPSEEIHKNCWSSLHLILHFFGGGAYPWHTEVSRLGVELGPQMPTYTTGHSNAGFLTHWSRPGIEPASSWIVIRFVSTAPQWELLTNLLSVSVDFHSGHFIFMK